MSNRTLSAFVFATLVTPLTACSHSYTPLSSFTIGQTIHSNATDATRTTNDHDVLWVAQDQHAIFRCEQTESGPVCQKAQVRR